VEVDGAWPITKVRIAKAKEGAHLAVRITNRTAGKDLVVPRGR
jgi:hypothetical protein